MPVLPASMTACASPIKRPCSTTPGMAESPAGKPRRVGNPAECSIDYPVAAVRDENVAVLVLAQSLDGPGAPAVARPHRSPAAWTQAQTAPPRWQRKPAEHRDPFAVVGNHDHRCGCRRDDLLAQQRAAAALDQGEVRTDLVGAVDREIERGRLIQSRERDVQTGSLGAGRFGSRYGDDVKAGTNTFAEQVHKVLGGRTRTQTEAHSRSHPVERTSGGLTFLRFDVHEFGRRGCQ